MRKIFVKSVICLLLLMFQTAYAVSGLLFNVTRLSSSLNISTNIPNRTYPYAGIRINTAGYLLATGCIPTASGYCLFSVSDTTSKNIIITGPSSGLLSLTLCLNGIGPLSCQKYSVSVSDSECSNSNPRCLVMLSKNLVNGAMNVTSTPGSPSVAACNSQTGVNKADCICGIEGPAANSGKGLWRAWLGVSTVGNPRERLNLLLGHSAFPAAASWISQATSLVVYPDWGALGSDINNYPDADNPISAAPAVVYTGGRNDSVDTPSSIQAWTCSEWTSSGSSGSTLNRADPGNPQGLNASNNVSDSWNDSGDSFCNLFRPIYCTEVQR
jgi:hypothetical protein